MSGTKPISTSILRVDFVGMMFALAIAQVGIELGDFYVKGLHLREHLYVATHLLLATYIIASSWIGWNNSKSKSFTEDLDNSFSRSFITLMIDLLLVIFYFILVKSVEKPSGSITIQESSSDVYWSQWIMGSFIIWDLITKLFVIENRDSLKFKFDIGGWFKRGWQGLFCYFIIVLFIKPMTFSSDVRSVVLTDLALLFTFLLFRGLKTDGVLEKGGLKSRLIRSGYYWVLPILGIFSILIMFYRCN